MTLPADPDPLNTSMQHYKAWAIVTQVNTGESICSRCVSPVAPDKPCLQSPAWTRPPAGSTRDAWLPLVPISCAGICADDATHLAVGRDTSATYKIRLRNLQPLRPTVFYSTYNCYSLTTSVTIWFSCQNRCLFFIILKLSPSIYSLVIFP